jgi:hypothetical protein
VLGLRPFFLAAQCLVPGIFFVGLAPEARLEPWVHVHNDFQRRRRDTSASSLLVGVQHCWTPCLPAAGRSAQSPRLFGLRRLAAAFPTVRTLHHHERPINSRDPFCLCQRSFTRLGRVFNNLLFHEKRFSVPSHDLHAPPSRLTSVPSLTAILHFLYYPESWKRLKTKAPFVRLSSRGWSGALKQFPVFLRLHL